MLAILLFSDESFRRAQWDRTLMMIELAVFCASLSAITGIFAVGSGRHWDFDVVDYVRGRRDAILYLWVTASTIFSICHAGVLVEHGFFIGWEVESMRTTKWLVVHSCVGILFALAHIMVWGSLKRNGVGPLAKPGQTSKDYLWGDRRNAIQ